MLKQKTKYTTRITALLLCLAVQAQASGFPDILTGIRISYYHRICNADFLNKNKMTTLPKECVITEKEYRHRLPPSKALPLLPIYDGHLWKENDILD